MQDKGHQNINFDGRDTCVSDGTKGTCKEVASGGTEFHV